MTIQLYLRSIFPVRMIFFRVWLLAQTKWINYPYTPTCIRLYVCLKCNVVFALLVVALSTRSTGSSSSTGGSSSTSGAGSSSTSSTGSGSTSSTGSGSASTSIATTST